MILLEVEAEVGGENMCLKRRLWLLMPVLEVGERLSMGDTL